MPEASQPGVREFPVMCLTISNFLILNVQRVQIALDTSEICHLPQLLSHQEAPTLFCGAADVVSLPHTVAVKGRLGEIIQSLLPGWKQFVCFSPTSADDQVFVSPLFSGVNIIPSGSEQAQAPSPFCCPVSGQEATSLTVVPTKQSSK